MDYSNKEEFEEDDEAIFHNIKQSLFESDRRFFQKLLYLNEMNVSAIEFGGDENFAIPLTASIVELSMIDTYTSPKEKLDCFCSSYDLVYAELKSGMIQLIAENAEQDNEIPVIDTTEIIPLLKMILVKSKLRHAFSNLYFIKNYCRLEELGEVINKIVEEFENATEALANTNFSKFRGIGTKNKSNIPFLEYMAMTAEKSEIRKSVHSVAEIENERTFDLISKSTEELYESE